jgi:hypothetical protein
VWASRVIQQEEGIFEKVGAYVGTVRKNSWGILTLHVLTWLVEALSVHAMEENIKSVEFRDKVCNFITTNIQGDMYGNPKPSGVTKIAHHIQHHDCDIYYMGNSSEPCCNSDSCYQHHSGRQESQTLQSKPIVW